MKIGFIGLGNMGSGMARNLIKAGFPLIVYNRTPSRAEALRSLGAQVAETPAQAASDVDVLITMLSDDRAVRDVIFAPGNVIESLHSGGVHISMSTISVALSNRLAEAHQQKNQHYIARLSSGVRKRRLPQNWLSLRAAPPIRLSVAEACSSPCRKRSLSFANRHRVRTS